MLISELTVYDFLKDQIKLSDSDARRYTRELFLSEERSRKKQKNEIKQENLSLTKDSFDQLINSIKKEFRQVTTFLIWIMFYVAALAVVLIKFSN